MVSVDLAPDEHKLIEIIREIKRKTGYGDFQGTITQKEIVTIKETSTYKLK